MLRRLGCPRVGSDQSPIIRRMLQELQFPKATVQTTVESRQLPSVAIGLPDPHCALSPAGLLHGDVQVHELAEDFYVGRGVAG